MFKALFFLHLLTAIFAVGPLVHAATTASRGLRRADAATTTYTARMLRIYAYSSVLVVVFGFAVMSTTSPYTHRPTASFTETWIWLSFLLWALAMALSLGVIAPALARAAALMGSGSPLGRLTARVAVAGSGVGLLFAVIVVLMVFQPGG